MKIDNVRMAYTVGSALDEKSFHSIANELDACTIVPFSRSRGKLRVKSTSRCLPAAVAAGGVQAESRVTVRAVVIRC